ncbi:MAG: hypothetical protein LC123_02385 [Burkholderiales bacterium]|nr:hypothetical protein [Burkholderiales bacterium]
MSAIDVFLHNWIDAVTVESAWKTVVMVADETLAEERSALADRPVRVVSFRWAGLTRDEALRIVLALADQTNGALLVPLYCDQAVTTGSSSGTAVACPTTNRRFFKGHYGIIVDVSTGRPTHGEWFSISVLDEGSITTAEALTRTYPAGSLVFPLLNILPILEPTIQFQADGLCSVALTGSEFADRALPALAEAGGTLDGSTTHVGDGVVYGPVLVLEPDWSEEVVAGIVRDGQVFAQGRAQAVRVRGERPRLKFEGSLLFDNRADAFAYLRFFDSRGGRLAPFWLVSPVTLWTATAIEEGYVDVKTAADPELGEALFDYVAIVMKDGQVHICAVGLIAPQGDGWRITFAATIPTLALVDVDRVTPALFVRFDADAIREEWLTDGVTRISFSVVEVLREIDEEIA